MSAQTAMPARTGKEFLQGLKDERQIWVGEERVRDVATHPALAGAARFVASLYDLQHESAPACLMPDPETGEPINVSHLIPRSLCVTETDLISQVLEPYSVCDVVVRLKTIMPRHKKADRCQ